MATDLTHPSQLDIAGGIVVWDEANSACGSGCPSMHAKNLSTGEAFVIADSEGETNPYPAISGDWAVWLRIDSAAGRLAIMARNIPSLAAPITLSERDGGQLDRPAIDGQWVVWLEGDDDALRRPLMLGRNGSDEVQVLAEDAMPLAYDVGGDVVVYVDSERILWAKRITTGEIIAIRGPLAPGAFGPGGPTTDGRYVFWSETRVPDGQIDIWGYDLQTTQAFQVTENGSNTHPHTAAGVLVWTHHPEGDAPDGIHQAARINDLGSGITERGSWWSSTTTSEPRPTPTVDRSTSCNVGGAGSTVLFETVGDLAWGSHQIVVGTVVEQLPAVWGDVLNPEHSTFRPIYTDYAVRVEQRMRGKPETTVRVRQMGGTIDGCTQGNQDRAPIAVGSRVLLFLNSPVPDADAPTYFLTGAQQGFWHVQADRTVAPSVGHYDQYAGRSLTQIRQEVVSALSSAPPSHVPLPVISLEEAPAGPQ